MGPPCIPSPPLGLTEPPFLSTSTFLNSLVWHQDPLNLHFKEKNPLELQFPDTGTTRNPHSWHWEPLIGPPGAPGPPFLCTETPLHAHIQDRDPPESPSPPPAPGRPRTPLSCTNTPCTPFPAIPHLPELRPLFLDPRTPWTPIPHLPAPRPAFSNTTDPWTPLSWAQGHPGPPRTPLPLPALPFPLSLDPSRVSQLSRLRFLHPWRARPFLGSPGSAALALPAEWSRGSGRVCGSPRASRRIPRNSLP